jgi:hypothetical protein
MREPCVKILTQLENRTRMSRVIDSLHGPELLALHGIQIKGADELTLVESRFLLIRI